jgi:hypothetical protein
MATGRTVSKHTRVYADGYDLSGYTRSIGPLAVEFDEAKLVAMTDGVQGVLPDSGKVSLGTLNGIFDDTATTGLHIVARAAGVKRTMMVPVGIRAAPAQGDPCFLGQFEQGAYMGQPDGNVMVATLPFENWSGSASSLLYSKPWGVLLHANDAAAGANTAIGVDDYGDATARGGYLVYQIFDYEGTGSAVITVQEADTNLNGSFALLSGATSGSIAHTAMPTAGLVAISPTADVKQFLRWQLALTTLTSLTFALAWVRG